MTGYLPQILLSVLAIGALIVIGGVFGPRAGAAKGRMWLGIGLIIGVQALSMVWNLVFVQLVGRVGVTSIGALAATSSLVSLALTLAGVAVLASAVVLAQRSGMGYLDPTRPGAPPVSGYPGAGYPAPGYQPAPRADGQPGSPYTQQTPEGFHRP